MDAAAYIHFVCVGTGNGYLFDEQIKTTLNEQK